MSELINIDLGISTRLTERRLEAIPAVGIVEKAEIESRRLQRLVTQKAEKRLVEAFEYKTLLSNEELSKVFDCSRYFLLYHWLPRSYMVSLGKILRRHKVYSGV